MIRVFVLDTMAKDVGNVHAVILHIKFSLLGQLEHMFTQPIL